MTGPTMDDFERATWRLIAWTRRADALCLRIPRELVRWAWLTATDSEFVYLGLDAGRQWLQENAIRVSAALPEGIPTEEN